MYFKLIFYSQDSAFESFFKIIDSKKKLHRNNFKPATKNNLGEEHYWIQGDNYSLKDNYLYSLHVSQSEFGIEDVYEHKIFLDRTKEWYLNDKLIHIIYPNGTKEWYNEGRLHRNKLPAVEYSNGDKEYWYYGQRHRIDGPAVLMGINQYNYLYGEFQPVVLKSEKRFTLKGFFNFFRKLKCFLF